MFPSTASMWLLELFHQDKQYVKPVLKSGAIAETVQQDVERVIIKTKMKERLQKTYRKVVVENTLESLKNQYYSYVLLETAIKWFLSSVATVYLNPLQLLLFTLYWYA